MPEVNGLLVPVMALAVGTVAGVAGTGAAEVVVDAPMVGPVVVEVPLAGVAVAVAAVVDAAVVDAAVVDAPGVVPTEGLSFSVVAAGAWVDTEALVVVPD